MKTRIVKMLCVLALSAPVCAKAQNSIQGKVTNQDGQALSGARITIENTYQSAFSNAEGIFRFGNLKMQPTTFRQCMKGMKFPRSR